MTQEERRALFHKKAEAGNHRNSACLNDAARIALRYRDGDMGISDAIELAWAAGCDYGKEHAEELKVFDNEKDDLEKL